MSKRLTSQELINLVDNLIGPTEASGLHDVDKQIEKNVMTLIDLTNWCLDGLLMATKTRHSFCASEREIGERAFSALCEYCDWLRDFIAEG